jgi:hypothetical protein
MTQTPEPFPPYCGNECYDTTKALVAICERNIHAGTELCADFGRGVNWGPTYGIWSWFVTQSGPQSDS